MHTGKNYVINLVSLERIVWVPVEYKKNWKISLSVSRKLKYLEPVDFTSFLDSNGDDENDEDDHVVDSLQP
jgi:hypothetical protein